MHDTDTALLDAIVREYADTVRSHRDRLTRFDEISGDGDFGDNLDSGLSRSVEFIRTNGGNGFEACAAVFLDEVGGTSGPLFGLLFQELALAARTSGSVDTAIVTGAGNGLDAIQRVGEAEPGDRTLVDALHAAVQAGRAGTEGAAIAAMAAAAIRGAGDTALIVARRGRSSYVGERALGVADPGAVGIALFFAAAARVLNGDRQAEDGLAELFA